MTDEEQNVAILASHKRKPDKHDWQSETDTNPDGSTDFDYCRYCREDGRFTQSLTIEQMIDHCAQFIDEVNKHLPSPITPEQYKQQMRQFFPMLKRWR